METVKYKSVMLVDDNEIDIFIGTKVLEHYSFAETIIGKRSSLEALDFLSHNFENIDQLPEFIFLDIVMPINSGFDFLDAFSNMPMEVKGKCKIVVLSSLINEIELGLLAKNSDVHSVVSKPLSNFQLDVLAN